MRRGGKQLETNDRSVGDEHDSALVWDEPASPTFAEIRAICKIFNKILRLQSHKSLITNDRIFYIGCVVPMAVWHFRGMVAWC